MRPPAEGRADILAKCLAFEAERAAVPEGLYPYLRPVEAVEASAVVSQGHRRVMLGSNGYLGLAQHPRVVEAAVRAARGLGVGCGGSRLLTGNLAIHEALEERLAAFVGKEAAIVYATGFQANQGALSALVGRHDVVYADRDCHASIVDGARLALGTTVRYRHGDLDHLEQLLRETRDRYAGAIVVTDGVFSMSGRVCDLPGTAALARRHSCRLYVDDAHAIGVLGPRGEGTEAHFRTDAAAVDVLMGSLSKALGGVGGFVAGSRSLVDYLKHRSRAFVFSTALPAPVAAAALASLAVLEEEPGHLAALWRNTRRMHAEVRALGFDTLGTTTPIVPILVGDDVAAFRFARRLYDLGVFVTPVVRPAVAAGRALVRLCIQATHTDTDLDLALAALAVAGRELGLVAPERG